jgi:hypothetical protein
MKANGLGFTGSRFKRWLMAGLRRNPPAPAAYPAAQPSKHLGGAKSGGIASSTFAAES